MTNILAYKLFKIGEYTLSLFQVVIIITIILAVWIFLKIFKKAIRRNRRIKHATQYTIYQIIKYLVIIIATIISLDLLKIDLSIMVAGSAALLVGVGLGLQNLFNDFVSGVIILLDSSIKVNDIIEVNSLFCRVQKINLRTTVVQTRDDKNIILPNSTLTGSQVINWTHGHETSRFNIKIGIDYSSDIHKAIRLVLEVAEDNPRIVKNPKPFVRLSDFGSSSVDLELFFWSNEVFMVENIKSDMRIHIFDKFSENGITIPFPQRVISVRNT
jgi:small-conductance mechanosensitive channel